MGRSASDQDIFSESFTPEPKKVRASTRSRARRESAPVKTSDEERQRRAEVVRRANAKADELAAARKARHHEERTARERERAQKRELKDAHAVAQKRALIRRIRVKLARRLPVSSFTREELLGVMDTAHYAQRRISRGVNIVDPILIHAMKINTEARADWERYGRDVQDPEHGDS